MAENNQGTSKHPHKSTDERQSEQSGSKSGASSHEGASQKSGGSQKGSSNEDLKSREHKDNQGNVHHHIHTAKEQGGKE